MSATVGSRGACRGDAPTHPCRRGLQAPPPAKPRASSRAGDGVGGRGHKAAAMSATVGSRGACRGDAPTRPCRRGLQAPPPAKPRANSRAGDGGGGRGHKTATMSATVGSWGAGRGDAPTRTCKRGLQAPPPAKPRASNQADDGGSGSGREAIVGSGAADAASASLSALGNSSGRPAVAPASTAQSSQGR